VFRLRPLPIELSDIIAIAIPAVLPGIPLLATVMPVADIVRTLLKLIA